jgi:hypothetical protein
MSPIIATTFLPSWLLRRGETFRSRGNPIFLIRDALYITLLVISWSLQIYHKPPIEMKLVANKQNYILIMKESLQLVLGHNW